MLEGVRARGDRVAELDALLALARAHYVRSLDEQEYAPITRATYEETYAFAAAVGDKRAMVEALLPTAWFTDYWADYEPVARANVAEAVRLTDELGDERLSIEAQTAALRFVSGPESTDRAEELRERLEAMHDPVRLKEHYFWLMWHYLGRAQFERCVETCDLGIDLARQLGSAPVQYGSIKTLALIELGRYDLVEAALGEEVTDDAHPFGQANQAYARAHYLAALEAWEPAAAALLDAMQRASKLSRIWMQFNLVGIAVSLGARAGDAVRALTSQVEAIAETAGLGPSVLSRAEADLASGRVTEARESLERNVADLTKSDRSRTEMSHALECLARAYAELGDWEKTLTTTDRALESTIATGQLPLTWRLRGCRADALDHLGRGDEAAAERAQANNEFDTLTGRIADPDLRAWFVRQPLAVRWLGRPSEATN